MCTPKVYNMIGPCRGLCESVRARCNPVLKSFGKSLNFLLKIINYKAKISLKGFTWPASLDCNRFPKDNNHENMVNF